jgi:predicted amidohydrolase YtcJ
MKSYPRLRPSLLIWPALLALACNLSPSIGGTATTATPLQRTATAIRPTSTPVPSPGQLATPTPTAADQPVSQAFPDVIFFNGTVITMEDDQPEAQAVAISGEQILAVGNDAEILALAAPQTQVIDLNERVMFPGFIDNHSHRLPQRFKWGYDTVEEAARAALAQGWTGLDELAVGEGELSELQEASAQGKLPVRVNAYLLANTFEGAPLGEWYNAYEPGQLIGSTLRIAGLKVFIDGDSGRILYWPQNELNEFLQQRQGEGWPIAIKAIGIQSHELALNAFAFALQGEAYNGHRHRIEHSLAANDEQVSQMVRMGIVASIQPSFPGVIWYEPDIHALVNEQGVDNIFRWRDYLSAGVFVIASPYNPDGVNEELTFSSHVSPMGLLYRSITQIGLGGSQPEPWMLEKTLSVAEILPMLTINGAFATFEEDVKGSLAPGKFADLVILSGNPMAIPPDDLPGIQVLLTMVGGQAAYCAPGHEGLCPEESLPVGNRLPEGFHDGAEGPQDQGGCLAEGWATDPNDQQVDLVVRILVDGVEAAQTTAGNYRPDLADAGVCPGGSCAFHFDLWGLVSANTDHAILVQAQDAQTGEWVNLERTPRTVRCQ